MKIQDLKDLINFIVQSELDEINIKTADIKISVKKKLKSIKIDSSLSNCQNKDIPADIPISKEDNTIQPIKENNYIEIKSPMIGTFYRASSPEEKAFVEEGTKLHTGQVVCMIEAMKIFNEIESEVAGKIAKVLVENASPVEYNQPLFLIDPS